MRARRRQLRPAQIGLFSVHRSDSSTPEIPRMEGSLIDARNNLSCLRSPLGGRRSVSLHHGFGSRLILCVCATEVTLEVILCEYSRQIFLRELGLGRDLHTLLVGTGLYRSYWAQGISVQDCYTSAI